MGLLAKKWSDMAQLMDGTQGHFQSYMLHKRDLETIIIRLILTKCDNVQSH